MTAGLRIEGGQWREERSKLLARRAGELDGYTWLHSQRVAALATDLGIALGYASDACEELRHAGLLHDVGKLSVPEPLLLKPGPLTRAERQVVRRHAAAGERLARWIGHADTICSAVRHHHERWDGAGYPDGLVGPEVPPAARLLAIADVYDALTTDRCYREAVDPEAALHFIAAEAGGAFDPVMVEAALPLLRPRVEAVRTEW
jgi:HD-GYP domain-containing protein (c-di-GMP phosphodiesterase class II)